MLLRMPLDSTNSPIMGCINVFFQPEHIKIAEECFHLVGSSNSECDTIHGRQCMAAAFFLAGQFEEVLVYLTSIKSYLHSGNGFLQVGTESSFSINVTFLIWQTYTVCPLNNNKEQIHLHLFRIIVLELHTTFTCHIGV